MKNIIIAILIISLIALVGCKTETTSETCNIVTGECSGEEPLADAEQNCKDTGGFLDERGEETYCIFTDGSECEVNTLLNEGCGETTPEEPETTPDEPEEPEIPPQEPETPSGDYAKTITAKEGELVKVNVEAIDEDGDKLTYKFSAPLNNKGEWQTKDGDAGSYEVDVEVSDGQAEDSETILIIIKESNHAPTIEVKGALSVKEGETVTLNIEASDKDGDEVIITIFDTKFKQQGDKFVWETDYTDAGTYNIKIEASDGKSGVSRNIEVVVEDKNRPPVITNIE